jgi:hypothetical protein
VQADERRRGAGAEDTVAHLAAGDGDVAHEVRPRLVHGVCPRTRNRRTVAVRGIVLARPDPTKPWLANGKPEQPGLVSPIRPGVLRGGTIATPR